LQPLAAVHLTPPERAFRIGNVGDPQAVFGEGGEFRGNSARNGWNCPTFRGALTWITEWGVWNALDEGIGYRLVESLNRASGQPSSFEIGQGHAFRADELEESVGMLLQPMIFGWDAYYLPDWAYGFNDFFLYVSHDSYVNIVTRTKSFHDQVFQQLQELDFSPKSDSGFRVGRICPQP
jgi:hypothetical protein